MRGVLHGISGGTGYEEYVAALRRDEELIEKISKVEEEIDVLNQLITLFILTTPMAATSASGHIHLSQLGQFQSAASDKQQELQDMVCIRLQRVHPYTLYTN